MIAVIDQELEVPEHALQWVVHFVRDAGDELAERGQLFGLRQLRAQSHLLGHVTQHEHTAG